MNAADHYVARRAALLSEHADYTNPALVARELLLAIKAMGSQVVRADGVDITDALIADVATLLP